MLMKMKNKQSKEYHHKQVILFYYEYIKKVIGIFCFLESNNLKNTHSILNPTTFNLAGI